MENKVDQDSVSALSQNAAKIILKKVKDASAAFWIISLNRRIDACESLFGENSFIDVAILGQFKAGKSSFINSIIGGDYLPVGVTPVTTVITRISHGPNARAVVNFFDEKRVEIDPASVEEFISEKKNPANEKNVDLVDIELPSLKPYPGLRFVDTPGLGSIFRYNTELSQDWLPKVGAAIIGVSCDRPLAENDLNLIRELMQFTPKIIILITKADLLSDEQQNEMLQFFRNALKREYNKEFPIFLYSTKKNTEAYRKEVDLLLVDISKNRDDEFKGIVQHKIRSLARQCLSYLDVALAMSTKADNERENLKRFILDERTNYDLMQSELSLIARESMQQTRTLISSYLEETHRKNLIRRLSKELADELPRWKGNLWKLTRRYEEWLEETMIKEMDRISGSDSKHFLGTLKKAHSGISRSVDLFRNLLDGNIQKVLGIKPSGVNWAVEVIEPSRPDVAFTKIFDFHFDLLWFLIPMFIFRGLFEKHFLKQIPLITDIHLSRLAYQWEVRINKKIMDIKNQALEYVGNELSTIDSLLSQNGGRTDDIHRYIQEISKLLKDEEIP